MLVAEDFSEYARKVGELEAGLRKNVRESQDLKENLRHVHAAVVHLERAAALFGSLAMES